MINHLAHTRTTDDWFMLVIIYLTTWMVYSNKQHFNMQWNVESIFVVNNLLRNHKHERIRRYSYAMRYSENRYQQKYRKGRVRGNRIWLSYKNHDATLRHRVLNSIRRVYWILSLPLLFSIVLFPIPKVKKSWN